MSYKFKVKNKRLSRTKHKVNSGWYLWIFPNLGSCWTSKDFSKSPSCDGGICIRKIWFGVHRLGKKDKTPKRIFRGCKIWRYYATEWDKTRWIQGVKHGRFKQFLEDLD